MSRIALIQAGEASSWISCQSIVGNLVSAYQRAFGGQLSVFGYSETAARVGDGGESLCLFETARKIAQSRPDRIVFVDHRPHPEALLRAIAEVYQGRRLPEICFHLYGDFTLDASRWYSLAEDVTDFRARFFCASERQRNLVASFFRDPSVVQICPFPVDEKHYRFDPALRDRNRARLGIGPGDFVVLYSGRMSLQKNVLLAAQEFSKFARRAAGKRKAVMLMAGPFDDLGAPFFGFRHFLNGFYQKWNGLLQDLPAARSIRYVGYQDRDGLLGLYHAGDLMLNLSLHHDEDFGMAPAEGLLCGMRSVLTAWGGLAGFGSAIPEGVRLVKVSLGKQGLVLKSGEIQQALQASFHQPWSDADREALSETSRKLWGIQAVTERLHALYGEKPGVFTGFNWRLDGVAQRMASEVPFHDGPQRYSFYEEIYGAYTDEQ